MRWLVAGAIASSTALIGFGLDSVIEVASAAAVAWQFSGKDAEARERTALKVIAVSFFALAAYVTCSHVPNLGSFRRRECAGHRGTLKYRFRRRQGTGSDTTRAELAHA